LCLFDILVLCSVPGGHQDLVLLDPEAVVPHEEVGAGVVSVVAVREVRVAVAIRVTPVRYEQVGSGPKHGSAVLVVRHGEQLLLDVELTRPPALQVPQGEQEGLVGRHVAALGRHLGPRHVREPSADSARVGRHQHDGRGRAVTSLVELVGREVVVGAAVDDHPALHGAPCPRVENLLIVGGGGLGAEGGQDGRAEEILQV